MDNLIALLRNKGKVIKKPVPGRGVQDCLVLSPRTEVKPGVFVEVFIPVEDFKTRFSTAASLKSAGANSGYLELVGELEKEGVL